MASDDGFHRSAPPNQRRTYGDPDPVIERPTRARAVSGGVRTAQSISGPDLTKPTGAVVSLLALNFGWTVFRTAVTKGPSDVFHSMIRSFAGLWFVGLGVLIMAEFNARLAVLFMVLVTVGNVVSDNAANRVAIATLDKLFAGSTSGKG